MTNCMAKDCDAPPLARGYCKTHYDRLRRIGTWSTGTCSVTDCSAPSVLRGMCEIHYRRVLHNGHSGKRRKSPEERLLLNTEIPADTDGCWKWTGLKSDGYGRFKIGTKTVAVHRFSYELFNGPIPEGLTIDHLCRNRACVNPSHLEAVTRAVNTLRGEGTGAKYARRTVCIRGHEFDYVRKNGSRGCSQCDRIRYLATYEQRLARNRERYHRRKAQP